LDTSLTLLLVWAASLLLLTTLAGLLWKDHQRWQYRMLRMQAHSRSSDQRYSRQMALLLDKSIALLAVKEPLAFQAVQAMNTGYDDSNSALTEQLLDTEEAGPANGYDESFLDELSDAGIDPEFFRVSEPNETASIDRLDLQPRSVPSE
jgi:hypothetical protein